jgi:hypothetical protein
MHVEPVYIVKLNHLKTSQLHYWLTLYAELN